MTDKDNPESYSAFSLWAVSFSAILTVHLVILGAVLAQSPPALEGIHSDAVLIDLPVGPSAPSSDPEASLSPPLDEPAIANTDSVVPPQPETPRPDVQAKSQEEVLPEPRTELAPELPSLTEADFALPKKTEPSKRPPSQAPLGVAPAAASGGRPAASQLATWNSNLALHLARKRRYPAEAQSERQQGVVTVRFTLDQSGRVLSSAIVKGSGFPALDREGLAMIQRAQPFPAPPPNMPVPIEIVVPVQFSLK